jgi:hypothetical protein
MKKILDIISQAPLFNGLSQEQLNQIRQIAIDKIYDKGKTVFLESDDSNGFYIVVSGKVKIYKVSFEGKEHILHIYGPGNPFGEVPVFSGLKFPANAETILKSRLLFIPQAGFCGPYLRTSLTCLEYACDSVHASSPVYRPDRESFLKRNSGPPGLLFDLSFRRANHRRLCFPDDLKRTACQSVGNHSGNPVPYFGKNEQTKFDPGRGSEHNAFGPERFGRTCTAREITVKINRFLHDTGEGCLRPPKYCSRTWQGRPGWDEAALEKREKRQRAEEFPLQPVSTRYYNKMPRKGFV